MPVTSLLIANREIAIRIARAAADLGLRSVAVHSRERAMRSDVVRIITVWKANRKDRQRWQTRS
jgi:acetyl/propionyl-CoA carboxylase alpha subunit